MSPRQDLRALDCKSLKLPCVCANLHRADRVITELYEQALRPAGLRTSQFTLLRLVQNLPGVSQTQIATMLELDISTLTRTLRALEKRGLLRFDAKGGTKLVYLTAAGEKRMTDAVPRWLAAQGRLREALGERRYKRLQSEVHEVTHIAGALR
jgi:DNA-binding MarR family transcriptional regulator